MPRDAYSEDVLIMASQGRYYRNCRRILRLRRYGRYKLHYEAENSGAIVYICRHRNAIGPLACLCVLPLGARPWAFAPFMDPKACREHLAGYTFPITWKLGPVLSRVLAAVLGPLFAWLVCSTGAIPVYRNSLKVRETYQQSMKALEEGDRLLIFPDINYAEENGEIGALYEGFLLLEQLWNRKTGGHIQFVPVNVSVVNRTVTVGKGISFSGSRSYREEKDEIVKRIEETMDAMAKEYGA